MFKYKVTKNGETADEFDVPDSPSVDPDAYAIETFYVRRYNTDEYKLEDDMGYDVLPALKLRRITR